MADGSDDPWEPHAERRWRIYVHLDGRAIRFHEVTSGPRATAAIVEAFCRPGLQNKLRRQGYSDAEIKAARVEARQLRA